MLEVRNVTKVYRQGRRWVRALVGVSLHVTRGEFVAVVGRSGSGKSTLLHLLGGLDEPTSGQVLFDGHDLRDFSDRQRALLRRSRIGFVFQLFNLLPTLSAAENVALPLLLAGESAARSRERARVALDRVGLAERAGHFPEELSGGEMQRVAIARALVADPEVVLCDEPTGSLDSATAREVLDLLRGLVEAGRRSFVLVTHDPAAAGRADRVIRLADGRVELEAGHRGQDVHALSYA
jgi:putative ABC transport system ATP-binding protein